MPFAWPRPVYFTADLLAAHLYRSPPRSITAEGGRGLGTALPRRGGTPRAQSDPSRASVRGCRPPLRLAVLPDSATSWWHFQSRLMPGCHWGAMSSRSPEASAIVCRFVTRTTLLIAMTCALVACGTLPAAATQSTPSAAASPALSPAHCARGYSETSPTINLANGDDGRSVTVQLCTAVWVALRPSDRGSDWQFVQSSDPAVLAVVPLPLPFILGGVQSVYLAERVGNAQLSSSPPMASCPPNAMCLAEPRWTVTVAVVP